jgi:hypothetical protein
VKGIRGFKGVAKILRTMSRSRGTPGAEAAKRGRTDAALLTTAKQHKARETLAAWRLPEGAAVADPKTERQAEPDRDQAAPIRYVPELIGAGTDPEKTGPVL